MGLVIDSLTYIFQISSTTKSVQAEVNDRIPLKIPEPEQEPDYMHIAEVPQRVAPTHDIPVCNLQMRGYLPQQLDFFADFARRAAFHMGMPCSGTVPLPTQTSRWTVIKSPFVHKKSQENFERKTHKRLLQIKDSHPDTVQRWLQYLTMNAPAGIGMRATTWEFEPMSVGKSMVNKKSDAKKTA
ncbi:mitochondrial 37S ribosomal protein rsm10 [Apophysomyces sp. BC1034]|nr:mitochondrial 37S ribosomal protein rsm10 [Apophysomyces sp. BC1015]KAG0185463.1 mitochondrial 37S ribosomal protein rsm10 [Apophysomyces sp. BC1034]